MEFTTKIPIKKSDNTINYDSRIFLIGSCFSENIGHKFEYHKFQNLVNPFGILFNTKAILNCIKRITNLNFFTEEDIFYHNELWQSYQVHSNLSKTNKSEYLKQLNDIITKSNSFLKSSNYIIITLGTSWVYTYNESKEVVANCHKVPQKNFSKKLLTSQENKENLLEILNILNTFNPNCKIIFTISPVRHIKDGYIENSWSKANLFSALSEIIQKNKSIEYFPSYEIVSDELRDYRFYNSDLIHPNQMAIDYIWERFSDTYFDTNTKTLSERISKIQKSLAHKPFNSNTESHQKFLQNIKDNIEKIILEIPHINFS